MTRTRTAPGSSTSRSSRSAWTCIFGARLPGRAHRAGPELEQGCCSYGAHFTDDDDIADTSRDGRPGSPTSSGSSARRANGGRDHEADAGRRGRDPPRRRCVHLPEPARASPAGRDARSTAPRSRPASDRSTGSPTSAGSCRCAWRRRPTTYGHVTSTLREWKRRDWGAGGVEFHWWCTEDPRRVRRPPAGLRGAAGRDHRAGRRGALCLDRE